MGSEFCVTLPLSPPVNFCAAAGTQYSAITSANDITPKKIFSLFIWFQASVRTPCGKKSLILVVRCTLAQAIHRGSLINKKAAGKTVPPFIKPKSPNYFFLAL
jgi:hypothetical protein